MSDVLEYDDLDVERVDAMLARDGEVLVSLPAEHAGAFIAFIEAFQRAQGWDRSGTPMLARIMPLAASLLLTVRMSLRHGKLFQLSDLVTLDTTSRSWTQTGDDRWLFRFAK